MEDYHDKNYFLISNHIKIDIKDLFFLEKSPCNLYFNNNGEREILKKRNQELPKDFFFSCLKREITFVYTDKESEDEFIDSILSNAIKLGRSISQHEPLNFAKKLLHFMVIFQKYLIRKPISENLINYQMLTFKIWLTFINKHKGSQLKEFIKLSYEGPYDNTLIKNVISATFIYKLSKKEQLFSEQYCQNLALACLFSEIGISLFDRSEKQTLELKKRKIGFYSNLILSCNSNLPPQSLKIIINGSDIPSSKNKISNISGQETYYFASTCYLINEVFRDDLNGSDFDLKAILTTLKSNLSKTYHQEFKNIVNLSVELLSWSKVPDQLTQ